VSLGHWLGVGVALAIFFSGIFQLKLALRFFEPAIAPLLQTAFRHPLVGVGVGFISTAIVQSSSATNAVAVGFVSAGVLRFPHAFAILLGSNIGTTLTSQLVAFGTFQAGLLLLTLGLLLQLMPTEVGRKTGAVGGGVGGMFLGLWALGEVLSHLAGTRFGGSIVGIIQAGDASAFLFGAGLTGIVQSSSAVSSLMVVMAGEGSITVRAAIACVLGSNVGTVVTTLLASIGGGVSARRTAMADLLFNGLGVALFWPVLGTFATAVASLSDAPARQVAHAHTLFNMLCVALVLPIITPFCRFVTLVTSRRAGGGEP